MLERFVVLAGCAEAPSPRLRSGCSSWASAEAFLRAFRSRPWLWITVAYFTLYIGFVYSPYLVLGPAVARSSLGGAGAWAAISTAMGIGVLAGGVAGLRVRPRHPLRVALLAFLPGGPALFVILLPAVLAVPAVRNFTGRPAPA